MSTLTSTDEQTPAEDGLDPLAELGAMQAVTEALKPLRQEQRVRVISWASGVYGVRGNSSPSTAGSRSAETARDVTIVEDDISDFEDFADLFDRCIPRTDSEKALVAGYWLQEVQNQKDFKGSDVNIILKGLGFGVSNITDSLGYWQGRRPNEVMQTGKSGASKQARKTYRLTRAGLDYVRKMAGLAGASTSDHARDE